MAAHHESKVLRNTLRFDGITATLIGIDFLIFPGFIGRLIGLEYPFLLEAAGVAFIVFGLYAYWTSRPGQINRVHAMIVAEINFIWVAGSIIFLAAFPEKVTPLGWWVVALTAVAVAVLAVLEYRGTRALAKTIPSAA